MHRSRLALLAGGLLCLAAASALLPQARGASASGVAVTSRPAPGPGAAPSLEPAVALSSDPLEKLSTWRDYVLDSPSPYAYPRSVAVGGDVSRVGNPNGLMAAGGGATTISTQAPGQVSLVLDFGVDVGGRVQVQVATAQGGPLRLAHSEARSYLEPEGDTRNVPTIGLNDEPDSRFELISTPGLYQSQGIRGAQRYVLVQLDGPGSFSIDFVRVQIEHLRPSRADYAGRFISSSPVLNRIWYASAYTLNLNTASDPAYPGSKLKLIDGGKRDRLIWLGDLAMEALAGYYTVRQMPDIAGRSLRTFGCQQLRGGYIPMASDVHVSCGPDPGPADGPPLAAFESFPSLRQRDRLPQFTPFFVIAACEDFAFSGNVAATRALLPVMRRAARYLESKLASGGLFETPEGAINWRAFDLAAGVDAYTNALWVRALTELAEVEEAIGDPQRAAADRARARRLSRALVAALYDPAAHLFRANTASPVVNHPQDASVEAVLAGVLNEERSEEALRALRGRLWTPFGPLTGESSADPYVSRYISPFMSGWELLARLQHYQGDAARELLESLWGRMLAVGTGSTVWEAMAPDGLPVSFGNGRVHPGRTSLAHGWGAAPVPALSGYVAGLRPATPGWEEWIVEPQTLDLRFAQGQVGTPRGVLAARWAVAGEARSFKLTVDAPRRTSGTVAVPLLGAARTIARDGEVVWDLGRPLRGVVAERVGGYVRFAQPPGRSTYAWVEREARATSSRRTRRPARVSTAAPPRATKLP